MLSNQEKPVLQDRPVTQFSSLAVQERLLSCDFCGGPVVRTLCFHCRGMGSIPGWGTKILHVMWHGQKFKKWLLLEGNWRGGLRGCSRQVTVQRGKIITWPGLP